MAAGARFLVSPGWTDRLLDAMRDVGGAVPAGGLDDVGGRGAAGARGDRDEVLPGRGRRAARRISSRSPGRCRRPASARRAGSVAASRPRLPGAAQRRVRGRHLDASRGRAWRRATGRGWSPWPGRRPPCGSVSLPQVGRVVQEAERGVAVRVVRHRRQRRRREFHAEQGLRRGAEGEPDQGLDRGDVGDQQDRAARVARRSACRGWRRPGGRPSRSSRRRRWARPSGRPARRSGRPGSARCTSAKVRPSQAPKSVSRRPSSMRDVEPEPGGDGLGGLAAALQRASETIVLDRAARGERRRRPARPGRGPRRRARGRCRRCRRTASAGSAGSRRAAAGRRWRARPRSAARPAGGRAAPRHRPTRRRAGRRPPSCARAARGLRRHAPRRSRLGRARRRVADRPGPPARGRGGVAAPREDASSGSHCSPRLPASIASLASRSACLFRSRGIHSYVTCAGREDPRRLGRQRLHVRVLDLPAARHLLDDELGVHPDLDRARPGPAHARPAGRRSGPGTRRRCSWRRRCTRRPRRASRPSPRRGPPRRSPAGPGLPRDPPSASTMKRRRTTPTAPTRTCGPGCGGSSRSAPRCRAAPPGPR